MEYFDREVNWRAIEGALDDVGEMHGKDAVRRYLQDWLDTFEGITTTPTEVIDAGDDLVVAALHVKGRARLSGIETELRYAVAYTIRDGRITRGREYADRDEALRAVGLTEQTMSEGSTTPDREELAALFRTTFPDGTDWAHLTRDDDAWAAFWQPFVPSLAPDFVYEDNYIPDHVGETYRGLDGLRRASTGFVEPYEEMVYVLERIVGSGEHFVSIHRVRTKARHSGIVQDFRVAYIWDYRGGRLIHCRGLADVDEALRAAGLAD